MRLAAATWAPVWHDRPGAWLDRYRSALAQIRADRDTLVVFPEYAALEAAFHGAGGGSAAEWMARGAASFDSYCDGIRTLVSETGATILGGSGFARDGEGIVNRALFCAPEGEVAVEKRMPTPYERTLGLRPGRPAPLIETRFGALAAIICYDSEFPLIARSYAEAGAEILLVPSCTDTEQGASRVEIGCRARALEGQMLVAMAPLVGEVPECEVVDVNLGRAAVFCPPDTGLPPDGTLAAGPRNAPGFAILNGLEAERERARKGGQVGVRGHWTETETGPRAFPRTILR
ncbi:nitrilase-related carbon-nitrogen hydrolase [Celeribacter indicus]|uniref:Carbon-nitrogen family hydrolase n=1 Tax=Celeribacter indicus TaxID=1208324 RepID=A0A0B5DRF4_9RHOB|nr:nitrilase-related carbon-nitrogen hydrolase [Celeribacter indicus]AJE46128.1 carbon-nitrogen family hydrolase [Celeribacter indicus]SDX37321.1 Predicted amidohydrolase [Celeribacter indicus]